MEKQKIDLIRQALSASESSIRLARTLLNELEKETPRSGGGGGRQQSKSLPGVTGIYDGENMVTESGDKHPVPENYASKSILLIGDTLKLVEEGGQKRFKQIEHVKRHKTTGILTKKDGKWAVVTPEGSYKILAASVGHFSGNVGDEALVQLPAKNLQVPWAAVEKIAPKGQLESKQGADTTESKDDKNEETAKADKILPETKREEKKDSKETKKSESSKVEKKPQNPPKETKTPEKKHQQRIPLVHAEPKKTAQQTVPAAQPAEDELS